MSKQELFDELIQSIIDLEEVKPLDLVKKAIEQDIDVIDIMENAIGAALKKLGDLWEAEQIYLPEIIMANETIQQAFKILTPHLKKGQQRSNLGTVVIATIEGDIHSIGKTIVGSVLNFSGFEVVDLGADVRVETIIDEAVKNKADVIGISALLTTTMTGQKKVIEQLKERGMRDQFRIIIGGAPVTQEWAEKCGADGYAADAFEAVKIVKKLLG